VPFEKTLAQGARDSFAKQSLAGPGFALMSSGRDSTAAAVTAAINSFRGDVSICTAKFIAI